MTSAFSWQNYYPLPCFILYSKAKFPCYPRCFLTSYFAFQSPIMKRTSLLGVSSKRFCISSQNRSTSASSALLVGAQSWIIMILNGLPWKRTEIILSFLRLHSNTAFWTLLLTMMATPFLLRDSCPQQQIQWSSELNSPIPVHFSSLIPRMLSFSLAISYLTTSSLPRFMDQTFQVPMQYCSLQHQTLLLSPVTSTSGYCFCFGSIPSFFLELFIHLSPVAYWALTDLGHFSFSSLSFAFSYCSWGSQGNLTPF